VRRIVATLLVAACAVATATSLGARIAPASAESASSSAVASVDCATASKTMMAMEKAAMMPPTGNVARDFTAMMAAQAKMMMDAAEIEMRCGKDPKVRRMAESASMRNLEVLRNLRISTGATH